MGTWAREQVGRPRRRVPGARNFSHRPFDFTGVSNERQTKRQAAAAQAIRELEKDHRRRVRLITAGVLVGVLAVGGGVVALTAGGDDGGGGDALAAAPSTSASPANLVDGAISRGSGPVTVTLYEDLQCPACQAFEERTRGTLDELVASNAITLERRPLAFLDRASTDAYSTRALNAVACVLDAAPDAVGDYTERLFADQPEEGGPGLSDATLAELARSAGAPDVSACITELRFKGWTERQTETASQAGVDRTPTVLVDGEAVEDLSAEGLRAAVEAA